MPTIGEVVRRLRDKKHISQRELERLTGRSVSRGYVASLEKGKIKMPSKEKLDALASALDVTTRYILEQAGIIEPVDRTSPYLGELDDMLREFTDEEQEEILAYVRWRREQKKRYQARGIQGVA